MYSDLPGGTFTIDDWQALSGVKPTVSDAVDISSIFSGGKPLDMINIAGPVLGRDNTPYAVPTVNSVQPPSTSFLRDVAQFDSTDNQPQPSTNSGIGILLLAGLAIFLLTKKG